MQRLGVRRHGPTAGRPANLETLASAAEFVNTGDLEPWSRPVTSDKEGSKGARTADSMLSEPEIHRSGQRANTPIVTNTTRPTQPSLLDPALTTRPRE